MPFSMHRALASAISSPSKSDPKSENPHTSATGRLQNVTMPKPPADNTKKPELKPVNLGRDTSMTSINLAQPEERMDNLVTEK